MVIRLGPGHPSGALEFVPLGDSGRLMRAGKKLRASCFKGGPVSARRALRSETALAFLPGKGPLRRIVRKSPCLPRSFGGTHHHRHTAFFGRFSRGLPTVVGSADEWCLPWRFTLTPSTPVAWRGSGGRGYFPTVSPSCSPLSSFLAEGSSIGHQIVSPGRKSRAEKRPERSSRAHHPPPSFAFPMLLLAALIEAFVRQSGLSTQADTFRLGYVPRMERLPRWARIPYGQGCNLKGKRRLPSGRPRCRGRRDSWAWVTRLLETYLRGSGGSRARKAAGLGIDGENPQALDP